MKGARFGPKLHRRLTVTKKSNLMSLKGAFVKDARGSKQNIWKASGISPEVSELDRLLEEIIEKESLVDSSREGESVIRKNEQNRKAAEDMRKTAMERMG